MWYNKSISKMRCPDMSFRTNQSQQITLHDSFINQTPRTQKLIMKSWCKDFADIVFPAIDEGRFAVLYSDNDASRPNTPVNVIVGGLMLKESNGLTDDELVGFICCDVRFQYALHTTHLREQPVSDRTFSRFRERLYHYEMETGRSLLEEEMVHLADVYAKYMGLNSNLIWDAYMQASDLDSERYHQISAYREISNFLQKRRRKTWRKARKNFRAD